MTDLLTAHAANQPDQLAVVDDRGNGNVRTLTSTELGAHSNRLVHALLGLGARVPRSITWLDRLPKTGKALERELRQPFWEGHGSNV